MAVETIEKKAPKARAKRRNFQKIVERTEMRCHASIKVYEESLGWLSKEDEALLFVSKLKARLEGLIEGFKAILGEIEKGGAA